MSLTRDSALKAESSKKIDSFHLQNQADGYTGLDASRSAYKPTAGQAIGFLPAHVNCVGIDHSFQGRQGESTDIRSISQKR